MSNNQNLTPDQSSKPVEDWTAGTIRFARLPLEVLRMGLSLNQLKVFLVIASYASKDGSTGTFSPCQDTIAEVLGWLSARKPDRKKVSENLQPLIALKLVNAKRSTGINQKYHYFVNMPGDIQIDLSDRTTPEYLAQAKAKRQEVLKNYRDAKQQKRLQIKKKLAESLADSDFSETQSQSHSEFEDHSDKPLADYQHTDLHETPDEDPSELPQDSILLADERAQQQLLDEISDEYFQHLNYPLDEVSDPSFEETKPFLRQESESNAVDLSDFEKQQIKEAIQIRQLANFNVQQMPHFKFDYQIELEELPDNLRDNVQRAVDNIPDFFDRVPTSQSLCFDQIVEREKEKFAISAQ